ncbi:MAG: hypothetical protein R3300_21625 [Candidatus Promineifilaceae bacterium]|nr:hypothetical protein [Candidatus Promineifilaceae bacterium]
MNQASRWRWRAAERLAAGYAEDKSVAAIMIVSSTARGHADRFSDLDMVFFWRKPPREARRRQLLDRSAADLVRLYPYDPHWHCCNDSAFLGRRHPDEAFSGLKLDLTHFTVGSVESLIQALTHEMTTVEPAHNLGALLANGQPLSGHNLINQLRGRLNYSEALATAMVMKHGQIDFFWRWRSALARNNNMMLVQANFVDFAQKLLRTLLALNRVFFFGFGWLDLVLDRLQLAPAEFERRYRELWHMEPAATATELAALIEETYDLVEVHLPQADVERLRRLFRFKRVFWEEAPPGLI